ncbi:hypothetical protein KTC96_24055 (plasmid) [Clostridium estertheticum]|nr:hypothetical protein [Clostridium estertheticum]MBX4262920.1 hypothetical protein [Clostridium estertheticum]WLC73200.1 hypothetical protein KTC96_24055 [Clostridium estertheticum]
MNKLVMRFLTTIEGKYFTLSVDDIKADDKEPTWWNLFYYGDIYVA